MAAGGVGVQNHARGFEINLFLSNDSKPGFGAAREHGLLHVRTKIVACCCQHERHQKRDDVVVFIEENERKMIRIKRKRHIEPAISTRAQCGSLTLQIITSLLAFRGLVAILTSDDHDHIEYSNDNTFSRS
eukprot:scaffold16721_cov84-Cylindrotheca_fusiformis.AAC.2